MSTETIIEVEDDAVVSIDLDTPELADAADAATGDDGEGKPAAAAPAVGEEADASKALQEALDKERKAREASDATAQAERKRAEDAGRLAASREAELRTAHETGQQREVELLEASLGGAQRELEGQQKALSDAMEAGDFKLAAEVQTKIAKTAAKVDRLEASKADVDAGKTRRAPVEGRVESPQPTHASPFEAYVSQYAPAAQTWLRSHPDCVPAEVGGNAVKNAKMMQGHYAAVGQGVQPNTPEYFAVIEKSLSDAPAAADPTPTPQARPKPRAAAPSAPPSREAPSQTGVPNKRSVTLNREQQEIARMSFPDKLPKEAYALYARNLLELQAEGKLGRATH